MKRVAVALLLTLLAPPASAQVEIRGLTIAPPDRPGNGGIMLKSLFSTRVPGRILMLWNQGNDVFLQFDDQPYKLEVRNGDLKYRPIEGIRARWNMEPIRGDFDGDGTSEIARYENIYDFGRLLVLREKDGKSEEIASTAGYGSQSHLAAIDLARIGRPQIIAVQSDKSCLKVLLMSDGALKDIGTLSCGATIFRSLVVADIDADGREDLIVAREWDRIEIFLR